MRFCKETIFIMDDIKSLFHQGLVPEYDRSLLRFLWWVNYDISGTVEDFEMKVHVFGAISSSSYCYYALKRAAVDNRKSITQMLKPPFRTIFM